VRSIHRALLCGASVLAIANTVAVAAHAADQIETVVVTGIRASLRDSLVAKRTSDLVTENISTKDIGQLPDVTIAEELNRLPGVNTQRDRGNASQASIRGLGPRFVFGLVNGREVASSEPTQDVRWEIFPSEILGGVQIYKTQDASLVPGGIAATIDIRTTDPLTYEGPSLQLNAGPVYNDEADQLPHYDGLGYRGSAGYIGHLSDTLAIAIAGSIQREHNGFPDMTSWGENQFGAPNGGAPGNLNCTPAPACSTTADNTNPSLSTQTPTPWGGQTEIKLLTQDRYGLAGAVSWQAMPDLVVKADAIWSNYQINEQQIQQWYNAGGTWGNWQGSNYNLYHDTNSHYSIDSQGHVVAATLSDTSFLPGEGFLEVDNMLAHYQEAHTVIAGGLNFDWTSGDWNAKLDLSHSEAWRNNRWLAFGTVGGFAQTSTFDYRADVVPAVTTPGFDPADINAQTAVSGRSQDVGPEYSRDHISAVTADVTRAIGDSFFKEIDFGGRFSDREKSHWNYDYQVPLAGTQDFFNPLGGPVALPAADLESFTLKDFVTPNLLYGNVNKLVPIVFGSVANTLPGSATLANCHFTNPVAPFNTIYPCEANGTSATGSNGDPIPYDNAPGRWQVKEVTAEGYLKTGFAHDIGGIPMTGSVGVRFEDVSTTSTGYQTLDGGATFQPVRITNDYLSILPSLNLTFHVADDQLVRFGAAIATSRPPLDALRTGYTLNPLAIPTPNGSGGDPTLKPFKSNQIDLDYEWYFHDESLFSVALFYKDITTFVGIASTQQIINGTTYTISSPANGKGGNVEGAEFTFQSRFFFLPNFLSDFGVYANYSLVDSGIKEFSPQFDPYAMGGLTKNSGEADLFYNRGGFETRLAFKYHSKFTEIPGWTASQLFELEPERTLDFSASYQWDENFGVRFQVSNLTNEVSRASSDNDANDLARYDVFGRRYLLNFSFRD
jgi:TonB-dependent receptor